MAKATLVTLICLLTVTFVYSQNASVPADSSPETVQNPLSAEEPEKPKVSAPEPAVTPAAAASTTSTASPINASPSPTVIAPVAASTPSTTQETKKTNGSTFVFASSLLIALSVVLSLTS